MFLVDTNVVSETRKPRPNDGLLSWMARADAESLFMSVMSAGEIRKGIESLRMRDASAAGEIETWLKDVERAFGTRLLPIDSEIADTWGRMAAQINVDHVDVLLAATAQVHGLTLVTRNRKHVEGLGVPILNPFSDGFPGSS